MQVGPMPLAAADKLIRILRAQGHEPTLGAMDLPEGKPEAADAYTLEFDDSYLEFVRAELVRLALIVDVEMVSTGNELEGTDWMCTKCGSRTSYDHPGNCPVHGIALVSFEDFAAGRAANPKKMHPVSIIMWIVMIVGALAWMAHR